MLKMFGKSKKKESQKEEIVVNKVKEKRDISKLKEEKQKAKEERIKRKEENAKKRELEDSLKKEELKKAEEKRKEELKLEQEKKQKEYEKRKEQEKKPKEKVIKTFEEEDDGFEIYGFELEDLKQGMKVNCKVLKEVKDEYIVDIIGNFKEAYLPKKELKDKVEINQELECIIYRHTNDDFYVSQRRLANKEEMKDIKNKKENGEIIEAKIVSYEDPFFQIEGDSRKMFVYKRNISLSSNINPEDYINKVYKFLIRDIKRDGNIELTRVPLLIEEQKSKLELVSVGSVVKVEQFNKNKAGIEFNYEGFRIFIPYKNLSHEFINAKSDLDFVLGKEAKVIECEKQRNIYNIVASIKDMEKDFFEDFLEANEVGEELEAKITRKEDYGVFLEIFPKVNALLHNSDTELDVANLNVGESLNVIIKEIKKDNRQVNLKTKK